MSLADRRLIVVTGKGGVGKTTVSAALAVALAHRGHRVLVAMVNAKERLSSMYEVPRIGPHNVNVLPGIDAVNMTPDAALEEYGMMTLRIRALYRLVFENRFVRSFLHAVPGLDAWSMLGKATYHAIERAKDGSFRYDTVILDAPATGHALSLLGLPRTLSQIAPPGQLRREAAERWELLSDPRRTEILPVTLLEEMPVTETSELVAQLRNDLRLPVSRVVLNAVPPARFAGEEVEDLVRRGILTPPDPYLRAARFDLHRRALQDEQRRRLASLVDLPTVELPRLGEGRLRRHCMERLAGSLAALTF
jgi:anion-transporting  ArsA/GET3 family ATPase